MNSEDIRLSGGALDTDILPGTLLLLVVASALILMLPRKYAVIPFIFASLMIPLGQVVVIGGLHFMVFRILILAGWVRLVASGMLFPPQTAGFKLNSIDRAVMWWVLANSVAYILLYMDAAAVVNRMGFAYTAIGVYFLMRFLVRDWDDIDRVIKVFSITCMVVATFMFVEHGTERNVFAVFGGVPESVPFREGRLRAQGPFAHPIIAGTLGATLVPLFIGMWWAMKPKIFALIGVLAALVMTITSASATPVLALAVGIGALTLWPFRDQMRWFRWGLVITLVGLHMVMKAPVWALIARINVVGGSSGDHRYELVNRAILHFWDWWLVGAKDLESWGFLMHDTVNEYVSQAVTGGLLGLSLFIVILVRCFRSIGLARKANENNLELERSHWCLGACLFANVVAFFGHTYFDQTIVMWYALLAMISTGTVISNRSCQTSSSLMPTPHHLRGNYELSSIR
jgi:hypothetical protein